MKRIFLVLMCLCATVCGRAFTDLWGNSYEVSRSGAGSYAIAGYALPGTLNSTVAYSLGDTRYLQIRVTSNLSGVIKGWYSYYAKRIGDSFAYESGDRVYFEFTAGGVRMGATDAAAAVAELVPFGENGETSTVPLPELPQRELKWTATNTKTPSSTTSTLETWGVFQIDPATGEPTGVVFNATTLEAGVSMDFSVYVAEDDPYSYALGRVDYQASVDKYGSFPVTGTAYGLNDDGTLNRSDPLYKYLSGVVPYSGSVSSPGNYASASPVTSVTGSGPGSGNTTPVVSTPSQSTGDQVSVTPGAGGESTATDAGTAAAAEQAANAVISAINNTSSAMRSAIYLNTEAVGLVLDGVLADGEAVRNRISDVGADIVDAIENMGASDNRDVVDAVNAAAAADAAARAEEVAVRGDIAAAVSEAGVGSMMSERDAMLAGQDGQAASLFGGVDGGMTAAKVTPTIGSGDPSAWEFDLGILGVLDINPFTNGWVQQKLPFLNWLVAFFRVVVVWSAQIAFYRYVITTIKAEGVGLMMIPSPPPTVAETMATSNVFTALGGKVASMISSVFLAAAILASLSTIASAVTTWGTISVLVSSISEGTNFISSEVTGLGASTGYLGRIVYFVYAFIPVYTLLAIGANYILVEMGLLTVPVLAFAMRIRRW